MLGEIVEVEINKKQSRPFVYKGQIKRGKKTLSENVYVLISPRDYQDKFKGKVIARFCFENELGLFWVVSLPDYIYYEPDITYKILKGTNKKIKSMICTNEKSCGIIVFNKKFYNTKVLLIKNKKNKNWSFPKGHIELGETEKETAKRETLEETGLEVKIIDGFREMVSYNISKKIKKNVVFFVAESETDKVKIQEKEVKGFKWATHKEVLASLRYFNDINIYNKAKRFLFEC